MVRFHGLCDAKRMVRKTKTLRGSVQFFCKSSGARYLIVEYHCFVMCRLG